MTRGFVAVGATCLAAAAALAWGGFQLLALPAHGSRVAESIDGGGDARRFGDALRLFADSVHETARTDAAFVRRARAEAALAAQRGSPKVRADADILLGVLAVRDATAQPDRAKAFLATAAAAFREALRLEPDSEEAAADLELLIAHDGGRRRGQPSGHGKRGAQKARSARHGRGSGAGRRRGIGY
ncbi:MAG: hypothetical protein ACJ77E_20990 [Gaiellaceae bacterium]